MPAEKDEITHDILAYLVEHPEAQDTLEGIVEWWLLEQNIKRQTALVKETLEELVRNGFIFERRIGNSETVYQINEKKLESIREFLKENVPE